MWLSTHAPNQCWFRQSISGVGAGLSAITGVTATMRQFQGKYVATIMSGLITSVNSTALFLTLVYDVFFFKDGCYENQNIQGYFLCLSTATILCHTMGVVVFGLSTVDESHYIPFQDTEDASGSNGHDDILGATVERKTTFDNDMSHGTFDKLDTTPHDYNPTDMLKSFRYAPLVLGTGMLMCLKYISLNNLNVMLASFRLPQYEASLPFIAPVSAVILRPIMGIFADWTRPYFSRIWYLYLAACIHLVCFVMSVYKADNIYVLSVNLILWTFASDTAGTIQPAVVADDFGSGVFSVNVGIEMTIFAIFAFSVQSMAGAVYDAHVPEDNTSCFGPNCFRETFEIGIGASVLGVLLISLYFYFWYKSKQWYTWSSYVLKYHLNIRVPLGVMSRLRQTEIICTVCTLFQTWPLSLW